MSQACLLLNLAVFDYRGKGSKTTSLQTLNSIMLVHFPLLKRNKVRMHWRYAYFKLKKYFGTHWNVKYSLFLLKDDVFTQFCCVVQIRGGRSKSARTPPALCVSKYFSIINWAFWQGTSLDWISYHYELLRIELNNKWTLFISKADMIYSLYLLQNFTLLHVIPMPFWYLASWSKKGHISFLY